MQDMTEQENNLECGLHHLERAAMGGDACAAAVLAEVRRLRADYANLEECYRDRDSDHQYEYDRANAAEKEVERLRADLAACQERERDWQGYGMARNEQLIECRARLESKSLGIELRNRGIDNLTGQIVQQQEAIGQLSAALKHYRTPDNWIHIPDDRGNMYWAWDGDGEPWQIAQTALEAQYDPEHPIRISRREMMDLPIETRRRVMERCVDNFIAAGGYGNVGQSDATSDSLDGVQNVDATTAERTQAQAGGEGE